MASKCKRKKPGKEGRPKSALEVLIRKKAKAFLEAEKAYWNQRHSLMNRHSELSKELSLEIASTLPSELSSTVWGLKDGVAFVRHKPVRGQAGVSFRMLPWTLEQWGKDGPILPLDQGDLCLGKMGVSFGFATLVNCRVNKVDIPYAEFAWLKYGDAKNAPTLERAILDFQLTLLGAQTQTQTHLILPEQAPPETTTQCLEKVAIEFETLLQKGVEEERLQIFLKEHPFVLNQAAEAIPKQKLGEDFITDFVLVEVTAQGPLYFMVEIERASHPLLTKDLALSFHAFRTSP